MKQSIEKIYNEIKELAIEKNLSNTLIALDLAMELHKEQKRKSGIPYIIHPLEVTQYLVHLGIDDDITLAAALLHDVIEDCQPKVDKNGKNLIADYYLDKHVIEIILILTKTDKITEDEYYENIANNVKALIIKLSDRANNCSTMTGAFKKEKMYSYVKETETYIFPLCKTGKARYPEYSKHITIVKYKLTSICETIEALLKVKKSELIDKEKYRKTLLFIKGYAVAKKMYNTLKALALAEIIHEGQTRTCGDPFIIHPLRVASYLISLKINSDITIAAALLHEVFKKSSITDDELLHKYEIDEKVVKLIHLVSKSKYITLEQYYEDLKRNPQALLIKLSNRANTCTLLHTYTDEDTKAYLLEDEEYLNPLCQYGKEHYKRYYNQICNMEYHISTICDIVECFII